MILLEIAMIALSVAIFYVLDLYVYGCERV